MEAFSAFLRASLTQCEHGLGIYVDHMLSIFSIKHLYLNGICKSRLVVENGKEKEKEKRKKKKTHNMIGPCALNIDIILGLVMNAIGRTYDSFKTKENVHFNM